MECNYCGKTYLNKFILATHQKSARFCLKIQGKEPEKKHICDT